MLLYMKLIASHNSGFLNFRTFDGLSRIDSKTLVLDISDLLTSFTDLFFNEKSSDQLFFLRISITAKA